MEFVSTEFLYFILSVIFLVISIILYIIKIFKKNSIKIDWYLFFVFVSLFFSGFFIVFFSEKDNINDSESLTNFAESLYMSLKLFFAGGSAKFDFPNLIINRHYKTVYYIIAFYAPLTLVSTIFYLFDGVLKNIKFCFWSFRRNVIAFSELSEQNIAIAENYEKQKQKQKNEEVEDNGVSHAFFNLVKFNRCSKKKNLVVFCNSNTECSSDLIEKANEYGYILFKNDIISFHSKVRKLRFNSNDKLMMYFLSGTKENENVHYAMEISRIEEGKKDVDKRFKNLAIFVFSESDADGHIIETLNTQETFFVKRIKPSLLMAIDIVTNKDNWLVSQSQESKEKDLKILILGLGDYGFELCKFLSWYYQRLEGNITLYLVDSKENVAEQYSGLYKDFLSYKPNLFARDQNACFECKIYNGVDVFSNKFANVLKTIYKEPKIDLSGNGIDAVFCVLGNDKKNIEAALQVRKLIDRINYNKLKKMNLNEVSTFFSSQYNDMLKYDTKIFSVVHSELINRNIPNEGYIKDCNIKFVGKDSSVYSCNNIFDVLLEVQAFKKHSERTKDNTITGFNNSEYNRNSSIAESLFNKFIEELYSKEDENQDYRECRQKIGNKRWNAYMLSIGYTCFPVKSSKIREQLFQMSSEKKIDLPMRKWKRGMWHNSIIPFDKLPKKEQINNYTNNKCNKNCI